MKKSDEEVIRVRMPKKGEILGLVESKTGASRMKVRCVDDKTRTCRIAGRIKRKFWIREGDAVIVVPWSFQDDKGDVIWRYTPPEVDWLKRKGHL